MTIEGLDRYISQNVLPQFKRFHDVDGAPYRIGDSVTVLDNPSGDETFDSAFVGKRGTVTYFDYDCGCGQTFPFDPMIGVACGDGTSDKFWREELELIR